MRTNYLIYLLLLSTAFLSGCGDNCNDCMEVPTKMIKYVDASGNNLFFGDSAIYNPDSLVITAENGQVISTAKLDGQGAFQFGLDGDYNAYIMKLADSINDTVSFNLGERESTSCCGNVTYSMNTYLNAEEISNANLITIIP